MTYNRLNKLHALIFDVDGTLVLSEKEGHWPACNDAFKQLGLPVQWDWPTFKSLLTIPGNANRLRFWLKEKLGWSEADIHKIVRQFESLKKSIYINHYLPALTLREGVENILQEAVEAGLSLAIVSTTYESQIHALLDRQLKTYKPHFTCVLGKESGPKTGANGILYQKCIEQLAIPAEHVLVIEDSSAGMQAALKAGLAVAVIYNEVTFGEDFNGAHLVARSLKYFNLSTLEKLCL